MKTPSVLIAAAGSGIVILLAWSAQRRYAAAVRHDPIECYGNFGGYGTGILLSKRLTKQQAEARAAQGFADLIGYYDSDGRRVRDVKIYQGAVFFENRYTWRESPALFRPRARRAGMDRSGNPGLTDPGSRQRPRGRARGILRSRTGQAHHGRRHHQRPEPDRDQLPVGSSSEIRRRRQAPCCKAAGWANWSARPWAIGTAEPWCFRSAPLGRIGSAQPTT
jgi:hypothetical protein